VNIVYCRAVCGKSASTVHLGVSIARLGIYYEKLFEENHWRADAVSHPRDIPHSKGGGGEASARDHKICSIAQGIVLSPHFIMRFATSHYIFGIAGVTIVAIIAWGMMQKSGPGPVDGLAQCLTEKGVMMYGAYWCPHCQTQKKAFGNSWQYVKYVECSLPGGRGQTQECTDAGIQSYPTWVFPGGQRLGGEQSFAALAEKAGCAFEGNNVEVPAPTGESMGLEGNTLTPTNTTPVAE